MSNRSQSVVWMMCRWSWKHPKTSSSRRFPRKSREEQVPSTEDDYPSEMVRNWAVARFRGADLMRVCGVSRPSAHWLLRLRIWRRTWPFRRRGHRGAQGRRRRGFWVALSSGEIRFKHVSSDAIKARARPHVRQLPLARRPRAFMDGVRARLFVNKPRHQFNPKTVRTFVVNVCDSVVTPYGFSNAHWFLSRPARRPAPSRRRTRGDGQSTTTDTITGLPPMRVATIAAI